FGLEAANDLRRVHAGLDDLQRDAALDGFGLLGQPDGAHAALADALQQLVLAGEEDAGPLLGPQRRFRLRGGGKRKIERRLRLVVGAQELLNALAQLVVAGALAVQEGAAGLLIGQVEGGGEQYFHAAWVSGHGRRLGQGCWGLPVSVSSSL